jgi:hypothetical protein
MMKNITLALALEGVPGFFGFFGFGWFYAGDNASGLRWLLSMLGYVVVEVILGFLTGGLSFFITVPVRWGILIYDLSKLSNAFKTEQPLPTPQFQSHSTFSPPEPKPEKTTWKNICPNCQKENPPDSAYCSSCGVPLK